MNIKKGTYIVLITAIYIIDFIITSILRNGMVFNVDWNVYNWIYTISPSEWYSNGEYYYSPFFLVLFYPFHLLSMPFPYLVLIVFIVLTNRLIRHETMMVKIILNVYLSHELVLLNIDVILLYMSILLYNRRMDLFGKGLAVGILCFKPVYVYTVLFYKTKSRNFLIGCAAGIIINYFYLLCNVDLLIMFISNSTMGNHPCGILYLMGLQYSWMFYMVYEFFRQIRSQKLVTSRRDKVSKTAHKKNIGENSVNGNIMKKKK